MAGSNSDSPRMHRWMIPQREYLRQETRRGRRHAYETVTASRTALVVIDMVPFFVTENPYCAGIVPNINTIANTLRYSGGVVAWVLPGSEPTNPEWAREFFGPDQAAVYAASGGTGRLQDRLSDLLDVRSDADVFVEKSAASAFFPGRCELPEVLAQHGVDTVLIAGTVTNVCCESSARDAATLGFRVIMIADANATVFDEWHNATLTTMYRSFGDVRPTNEIVELLTDPQ
jgi:nicotinamidase-related amidase